MDPWKGVACRCYHLLYSLVVNKIPWVLNSGNYYRVGYADDIAIVINEKFLQTLSEVLHKALSMVQQWCDQALFYINPYKIAIIPCIRNRDIRGHRDQLSLVKRYSCLLKSSILD
jgi:hypothetical protein